MPPAGQIELDMDMWPIVVTTPRGSTDSPTIDAFMNRYMDAIRPRRDRYISIVDLRYADGMDAKQRAHMQKWMDRCIDELDAEQAASALVFSSRLMRNLLTAILWIFKPKYPVKVFTGLDEALVWSRLELGMAVEQEKAG